MGGGEGGRMTEAVENLEVNVCESGEKWPRVVERIQLNPSLSLRKVLRQLQYLYRNTFRYLAK